MLTVLTVQEMPAQAPDAFVQQPAVRLGIAGIKADFLTGDLPFLTRSVWLATYRRANVQVSSEAFRTSLPGQGLVPRRGA
jgi:hypothetical protein